MVNSMSSSASKKYANRPSPSVSAQDHCGKTMRGNDGNMWLSKEASNGVCRWVKVCGDADLHKKLFSRIYKDLWYDLSKGSVLLIYKNGDFVITEVPKKRQQMQTTKHKQNFQQTIIDPNFAYLIWSSQSTDALFQFVNYLLKKLNKNEINDILKGDYY